MWRSRKRIKLKCGHFNTIMFCHMDSDLERNLLKRNLQSKFSLCLFPSKSDARFMEACETKVRLNYYNLVNCMNVGLFGFASFGKKLVLNEIS
jgi:hypothetical protein